MQGTMYDIIACHIVYKVLYKGLLKTKGYKFGVISKTNILIYLNIKKIDALNFIMSLFHASTCFEHMYSSSGGQIVQYSLWYHHTYRCDDTRGCIVQF